MWFLKRRTLSDFNNKLVYEELLTKSDQKTIERLFARLFTTEDGKKALAYLQNITFKRALGPDTSEYQLRYLEGQRSLVATILKIIERGRAE